MNVGDQNHRAKLQSLFVEHAAAVRAYALRRTDAASADDAVSEVFVIAWRRLEKVPDDALPWLLACARRVLANQRRSERRRLALGERLKRPAAQHAEVAVPTDGHLGAALAALKESDRELLLLLAWEGLEPEGAALVLGCSRRTIAVRAHRARQRLALALDRTEADLVVSRPKTEVS